MVGDAPDGGCVGASVVVEDDDDRPVRGRRQVVETLPGQTAGEGAVADDRDHVAAPAGAVGELAAQPERLGDPVGVGQGRGSVGVLDPVVGGLLARGITRQSQVLAQAVEVGAPAGEDLVDVGLMPGVEDDHILRRAEDPVQGDGQLDHAEIRPEVPSGGADLLDQERPDLRCQRAQVGLAKL